MSWHDRFPLKLRYNVSVLPLTSTPLSEVACWKEAVFMACKDPEQRKAYSKAYYQTNKDACLARSRAHYHANRAENIRKQRARYQANRERERARSKSSSKRYRIELKQQAFNAYGGPVCACCGETHIEFLTIDHIAGNGNEHRKQVGNGGKSTVLHHWLREHGYPPGFRVLCFNCNCSLGAFGYCPHGNVKVKKERPMDIHTNGVCAVQPILL